MLVGVYNYQEKGRLSPLKGPVSKSIRIARATGLGVHVGLEGGQGDAIIIGAPADPEHVG